MSTFLQLVQRLWQESGRLGAGPTAVTALVGDQARAANRIKDAWAELQDEDHKLWRWMRATTTQPLVVDQSQYTPTELTIDATFGKWWPESLYYQPEVLDAADVVLCHLQWLPYDEFRRTHLSQPQSGFPVSWSIAPNDDLLIGPAPSDTGLQLRIDYKTKPTELVNATDEPNMPARHHLLLVWMALEQFGVADESVPEKLRAAANRMRARDRLLTDQAENVNIDYAEPLA